MNTLFFKLSPCALLLLLPPPPPLLLLLPPLLLQVSIRALFFKSLASPLNLLVNNQSTYATHRGQSMLIGPTNDLSLPPPSLPFFFLIWIVFMFLYHSVSLCAASWKMVYLCGSYDPHYQVEYLPHQNKKAKQPYDTHFSLFSTSCTTTSTTTTTTNFFLRHEPHSLIWWPLLPAGNDLR